MFLECELNACVSFSVKVEAENTAPQIVYRHECLQYTEQSVRCILNTQRGGASYSCAVICLKGKGSAHEQPQATVSFQNEGLSRSEARS